MTTLYRLTSPEFTATSAPLSSTPAWADATDYDIGDEVLIVATGAIRYDNLDREYRCIQDHTSSAENAPSKGGNTYWLDLGAENNHRCFDRLNNSVTTVTDGEFIVNVTTYTGLQIKLQPERRAEAIILLGMTGIDDVTVRQKSGATVLTEDSFDLRENIGPVGWFTWLFEEYNYTETLIVPLLGMHYQPDIEIDLYGADINIAQVLHAIPTPVGITEDGASPGFESFSTFDPDDFGVYQFTPRKNTGRIDFTFYVDTGEFQRVFSLLRRTENELIVIDANNNSAACGVGTEFDALRGYGKITDVSTGISYTKTPIGIEFQGLN